MLTEAKIGKRINHLEMYGKYLIQNYFSDIYMCFYYLV